MSDLHFNQRVLWTNAKGAVIPAKVVDIIPGKPQVQIRVTHQRGAQLLWVRPDALKEAPHEHAIT